MCENGFLKFDLQRLESLWKEVPKEKEKQATTTNGTKQRWNEFQEGERDGSGDSLVVTDPTTNPPVSGLTMGERTGSRIFHYLCQLLIQRFAA
jgi:hypothetical protein